MEKMKFDIEINANSEKVWQVLWSMDTYPLWTAAFAPGSTVETDWKKGSKALFSDGKGRGMISRIIENTPNEYMSIQHLGMYDNGVEDFDSDAVKQWAGATENYTLKAIDNKTQLHIDMDISGEDKKMIGYFEKAWPTALNKVKELAEKA